jgi:hypothetical protein
MFTGSPSYVLAKKLKALKEDLKIWNREVFGDIRYRRRRLMGVVLELDLKEGLGGLSPDDLHYRDVLKSEVTRLTHLEESSWRQKSRVLWLKEGDNNTKFFHKVENSNRRRNFIGELEVDGVYYEEEVEMREHVVQFYETIFCEFEEWRLHVDGLPFTSIRDDVRVFLERQFEEEIIQVLKDFQGDKLQGQMGLQWHFFRSVGGLWRGMFWISLKRFMIIVNLNGLLMLHLSLSFPRRLMP